MNKRGAALVQGNAMAPRLPVDGTEYGSRRCVEQRRRKLNFEFSQLGCLVTFNRTAFSHEDTAVVTQSF